MKLKEQKDPRMFGNGNFFDQYPYANPGKRNFYKKYMNSEKVEAPWVNKSDFDTLYPRNAKKQ